MIIINEKAQLMDDVPPPYEDLPPLPFPVASRPPPTLDTLPPRLLLQIVHCLFPQTSDAVKGKHERQRMTLYYLGTSLRLVNRAFYVVSMHVLRSTYLPAYRSLIKPPYSSDPFPHAFPNTYEPPLNLQPIRRETKVLDHYIMLRSRQDVYTDDTELHLECTESFNDLFDLEQPKSRLEDLICEYGVEAQVISRAEEPAKPRKVVSYSALSINFSTRKVGLVLTTRKVKKTILEATRGRDEKLESTAKRLVSGLRDKLYNETLRFG